MDGASVEADLCNDIWDRNIEDYDNKWRTHQDFLSGPTAFWDWRKKRDELLRGQQPALQGFALEAEGETQGLMLIGGGMPARLPSSAGRDLLYVYYLEAAPWNQRGSGATPRFSLVASRLMILGALRQSLAKGYNGRVGLTSLEGADPFYRSLKMTDLGNNRGMSLTHFEWDEATALTHIRKYLGGAS